VKAEQAKEELEEQWNRENVQGIELSTGKGGLREPLE
jgi:hypothetical protein